MGTSIENGISVSFWVFLVFENRIFPFFLLVMGTSFENGISVSFFGFSKCQYFLIENGISLFFLLVMGTSGKYKGGPHSVSKNHINFRCKKRTQKLASCTFLS